MSIAPRLKWYLDQRGAPYELLPHGHTTSSRETASTAHVDEERLAKCVLLEDERGYLLAVLPTSRRISIEAMCDLLGRRLELATEPELGDIFEDCEIGAVPPLGAAYGIPTVVDEKLLFQPDVYFEAGDHENLVRMKGTDFAALFRDSPHGDYGTEAAREDPGGSVRDRQERQQRLDGEQAHVFSLRSYGAGLRRQPEYEKDGHTGMILMKTPELRVVLEATSPGTTLATHVVRGPATLLVLEGALDVSTGRGSLRIGESEMAVLPRDEARSIRSPGRSLFLLALSPVGDVARRSALPATRPGAATRRILIVANQTVGGVHLVEEARRRLGEGPCDFVVLAPASPSREGLVWEEETAREDARARLDEACGRLRALGISVDGVVGDFYPMRAVRDLLLGEEFDEIIVSTLPQGVSEWLKMDLPSRIARRFGIPVTHVTSQD